MNTVNITYICIFSCALLIWDALSAQEVPTVTTDVGTFNGVYKTSEFNGMQYRVTRFLGIRYGREPTGDLRFMKPEPFVYDGLHEATEFGSACPQVDMMGLGEDSDVEDCLFLNLFIPESKPDMSSGYSVIIFIHGGGYEFGSSSLIPGDIMAAVGSAIVVTFNYRLGIFGFLNPGDGRFPGNAGLWDQRLAIQWVHDNIRHFGGDPERVTLLGESNGAMSALIQGMYPNNRGLFNNIIAISGTPFTPPGLPNNNLMSAQYFAQLVVCYPKGETFKQCMQTTDMPYFMMTLNKAAKDIEKWSRLNFFPTVDGEMIKEDPLEMLKRFKEKDLEEINCLRSVGLLVGLSSAEGGVFVMHMANETNENKLTRQDMEKIYIPKYTPFVVDFQEGIQEDLINKLVLAEYTDWNNHMDARRHYAKFMGDINYNIPAMELLTMYSKLNTSRTWLFNFDVVLNQRLLPTPTWLEGANHGDILAPLFGFPDNFNYGLYRNIDTYTATDAEVELSRRLITHVTTFAKSG